MVKVRRIFGLALASIVLGISGAPVFAHDTLVHAVLGAVVYRSPERATEAGFTASDVCVGNSQGAIGLHFVHPDRLMDPILDATEPEVIIFFPTQEAPPHLAAVQWIFPLGERGAPIPANPPPAPKILGQSMSGPVPGTGTDLPPHYYLYMWLSEENPNGVFADFNPYLRCPAE